MKFPVRYITNDDLLPLENAIYFLKKGCRIHRKSQPEKGYLAGTIESPRGSFYLTLWDVLADDWIVSEDRNKNETNKNNEMPKL